MARTVVIEEPSPHEPLPLAAQAAAGSIRNLLEDLTAHLAPADTQTAATLFILRAWLAFGCTVAGLGVC